MAYIGTQVLFQPSVAKKRDINTYHGCYHSTVIIVNQKVLPQKGKGLGGMTQLHKCKHHSISLLVAKETSINRN